jgi:uroporphyrinogen-III synthase
MLIVETENSKNGFAGLRVLALENRRAPEMAKLIANNGGEAIVAPSMREIPLASNTEALAFARGLFEGNFDIVIFLTGGGTRALARVVQTVYPLEQFVAALRKIVVVARGSKPVAALKELGVPVTLAVPEPNTWRELLRAFDESKDSLPLKGRRVAVQEYGVSNPDLLAGLSERGAQVTRVPVYEWGLPEDVAPLRAAITAIARDEIAVVLFTTAMQVNHLFQVAGEMKQEEAVRRAFSRMLIASIGPVTSERLREYGLAADIEPTHPKMGFLVTETAECCAEILRRKRIPAK